MRLRTFSAPTMAEAMRQIRDALGDDAIIVSSHESERGRGVQVTAAAEAAPMVPSTVDVGAEYDDHDNDNDAFDESGSATEQDQNRTLNSIQNRSGNGDEDQAGYAGDLLASLLYHDVPETMAERLAAIGGKVKADDPVEALAIGLDRYFEFSTLSKLNRPVMLIGPPGAGKTVTVAKLAAAATLRGTATSVITTDSVRADAVAQLSGYTDILQLPMTAVDTPEGLHGAIISQPDQSILIDTPGTNPYNDEEMSDLSRFIDIADVDPVLVFPAGINAQDASEMAAAYSRLGCSIMIATQLDGVRRLGAILSAAQGGNLAFSVVSISASIAQGLTPLNPMSLARVLLRDPENSREYSQPGANHA
ncbi:MAG: GTP-binding protein [Rhodospirillaceae bacterium]|nr:GTP-binding protein [Rhodospirillaceae bacterium]MBT6592279.1 GTP-binding protein [Rhodospirillaceae bacterium]MBT6986519.1 GTP-binding protein [Rhodospirillaceae bacterium]MBT7976535.1 GTP-binding protein [Rhodospirillaceae bacterium]